MNLGQYIAQQLLEGEELQKTIAIFPGAFKPPHKGHFEVVKKLLGKADQVVVLISPKTRDGISADESIDVWNVYKELLEPNVEVRIAAENPVKEAYGVVKDNPDTKFILAFGKEESDRFKNISANPDKYKNAEIYDAGNYEGLSATQFRNVLRSGELNKIQQFLPDGVNPIDINAIFNPNQPEEQPEEINPLDNQPNTLPDSEQPLQELQLGAGEKSPYQEYVKANSGAIQAAAQYFNYPIPDLEYAFYAGMETVMSDDTWRKLENSNSYEVTSLEEVIKMAQKEGINLMPYIIAIKKEEQLPFPLVFNWAPDKYYLVGGNIILSLYRALNVIPIVLMATINVNDKKYIDQTNYELQEIEEEEKDKNKNLKKALGKFMKYATEALQLQNPPAGLTLSQDTNESRSKHTFGHFTPDTKKIWLYVKNRNTADILRTLAHELVHLKQAEDGRLDQNSGETGSPIENEANAMAGVLLRNFGKDNEFIYEALDPKKNYPIEDEIFSAFHGRYIFDVSKAYDLINKGEVKTKIETREPGTMHFMAHPEFSKTDPAKYKKLELDYDKPLGLNVNLYDPYSKETLWILIDGNHRTRKAVEEEHNGKYILVPNVEDTAKFLTINSDIPKKLSIDDED